MNTPKRFFTMEDIAKTLKISKCRHQGEKQRIHLGYGYFLESCAACGKTLELSRIELTELQRETCKLIMGVN